MGLGCRAPVHVRSCRLRGASGIRGGQRGRRRGLLVAGAHSLPRHAPGEKLPHGNRTPQELDALCPVFRDRILNELHAEVAVTQFDGELYLRLTAHAYVTADAIDRFAEQSIPTIVGWLRG